MNKRICILAFLISLFVISLFAGEDSNLVAVERDQSVLVRDSNQEVFYFYGTGCSHCAEIDPFIVEMEQIYPLKINRFDIYSERSSLSLFDEISGKYGIPQDERVIPTLFVGDKYFVGDDTIIEGFEEKIRITFKETALTAPVESKKVTGQAEETNVVSTEACVQQGKSELDCFSLLAITAAALVDSVSPCSIAILVFLIGARILTAKQKKRALKVGLSFCLAVFVGYFLFGLGLLSFVQLAGFSSIFTILVGLVALLAGLFYLKDVFWNGRGGFSMEVPRSLKPVLMKILKGVTNPFGAFLMGFVVVLFELPCTGGPYLYILGQLANSTTQLQAIPLLLYYNFIFILPLVLISLALYSKLFSIGKIREWNEKNKRLLRLVSGFTMVALGFMVIPVHQLLQFMQLFMQGFRIIGLPILIFMLLWSFFSFIKGSALIRELKLSDVFAFLLVFFLLMTTYVPLVKRVHSVSRLSDVILDPSFVTTQVYSNLDLYQNPPVPQPGPGSCVVPYDDLLITEDTILCDGIYNLDDPGDNGVIIIDSNHVTLDCGNAQLKGSGWGAGVAIYNNGYEDVTITNCDISQYDVGIHLFNLIDNTLSNNFLSDNSAIGIYLENVDESYLEYNTVRYGNTGISLYFSNNNELYSNEACSCIEYDIAVESGSGNHGIENECDIAPFWNDDDSQGCTFPCEICDDYDRDGICDDVDICPYKKNPDQGDKDNDCTDLKADSTYWDGTKWLLEPRCGDVCENCPSDWNPYQEDTDFDSVGDVCDICPDDYNRYQSDINADGVGDACDCYDVLQGPYEKGVDCGGPCMPCLSLPSGWSDIEPIRLRGDPNSGFIDVVFVPELSYFTGISYSPSYILNFRWDAMNLIRDRYFTLDQHTAASIPANYKDRFNFYYYTGGYGSWKPANSAGTLPPKFWNHAPGADAAGILKNSHCCVGFANGFGPPGGINMQFITPARSGSVSIHESAHAIFGAVDEYCGNNVPYMQHSPTTNVWSSQTNCQKDAAAQNWIDGNCEQITWDDPSTPGIDCQKNFWEWDDESCVMDGGGWDFGEACTWRINWVFDNWPSGHSKGILVHFNINEGVITELSSEVVGGHPDVGLQTEHFRVEAFSSKDELLSQYGMWDPRIILRDTLKDGLLVPDMVYSDNVNFTMILPFYENLKKFEIKNATIEETLISVDLTSVLQYHCVNNDYEGPECQSLDLDNNGVPDSEERERDEPQVPIWVFVAIIAIIVIIICVIVIWRRK